MIRKTIIAVLLTCTIATGALWAASYWTTPTLTVGDSNLRHDHRCIYLSLARGEMGIDMETRVDWTLSKHPHLNHLRPISFPMDDLFAGFRYQSFDRRRTRRPDLDDVPVFYDQVKSHLLYRGASNITDEDVIRKLHAEHNNGRGEGYCVTARSNWMLLRIPLWMPCLVFAIYPCIALTRAGIIRRRRRRNDLCLRCGYNLTGNTSGICSECGTPIAAATAGAAAP